MFLLRLFVLNKRVNKTIYLFKYTNASFLSQGKASPLQAVLSSNNNNNSSLNLI